MASAPDWSSIDWSVPWLAAWRAVGQPVAASVARGASVAAALNAAPGAAAPMRFVAQSALQAGMPYERFIFETGTCPTRDGLHDFFNGLAWLQFPQTKRRLNRLQASQIAVQGVGATRGAVRDAITLLDENAAFLRAPPALWDALAAQDWRRLFVDLRSQWASAELVVFGHAALEKLVSPRKPITVHVYNAELAGGLNFRDASISMAEWDHAVSASLVADVLGAKPFTPLPVLGVPGWWRQNADFSFYDDASVFRPRRTP